MNQCYEQAILGGGCFWCMEAMFQRLKGVASVTSGYSGGQKVNPTYMEVKSGTTGHYEVIRIEFRPSEISYTKLLEIFLHVHDPTQQNGQGEDIGSHYKSVIFTTNNEQAQVAKIAIEMFERENGKKVITAVKEKHRFYEAQDYHQNYFNLKGNENSYCQIIPIKIRKMKNLFTENYLEVSK